MNNDDETTTNSEGEIEAEEEEDDGVDLEEPAEVSPEDELKKRLINACEMGNIPTVSALTRDSSGEEVRRAARYHFSPLRASIAHGHIEIYRALRTLDTNYQVSEEDVQTAVTFRQSIMISDMFDDQFWCQSAFSLFDKQSVVPPTIWLTFAEHGLVSTDAIYHQVMDSTLTKLIVSFGSKIRSETLSDEEQDLIELAVHAHISPDLSGCTVMLEHALEVGHHVLLWFVNVHGGFDPQIWANLSSMFAKKFYLPYSLQCAELLLCRGVLPWDGESFRCSATASEATRFVEFLKTLWKYSPPVTASEAHRWSEATILTSVRCIRLVELYVNRVGPELWASQELWDWALQGLFYNVPVLSIVCNKYKAFIASCPSDSTLACTLESRIKRHRDKLEDDTTSAIFMNLFLSCFEADAEQLLKNDTDWCKEDHWSIALHHLVVGHFFSSPRADPVHFDSCGDSLSGRLQWFFAELSETTRRAWWYSEEQCPVFTLLLQGQDPSAIEIAVAKLLSDEYGPQAQLQYLKRSVFPLLNQLLTHPKPCPQATLKMLPHILRVIPAEILPKFRTAVVFTESMVDLVLGVAHSDGGVHDEQEDLLLFQILKATSDAGEAAFGTSAMRKAWKSAASTFGFQHMIDLAPDLSGLKFMLDKGLLPRQLLDKVMVYERKFVNMSFDRQSSCLGEIMKMLVINGRLDIIKWFFEEKNFAPVGKLARRVLFDPYTKVWLPVLARSRNDEKGEAIEKYLWDFLRSQNAEDLY